MTERSKTWEQGRKIRREVLGAEQVERGAKAAWAFAEPYQELVEEYCWGAVWGRPGLSRRDRSLLNLGMLVALNRANQLAVHIHGALNNGVTPEEIREVFMQAGIYCGVPAGHEGLRVAREVFKERGIALEEKPK
jgi:4-carboxymuconolactone decarboxylase